MSSVILERSCKEIFFKVSCQLFGTIAGFLREVNEWLSSIISLGFFFHNNKSLGVQLRMKHNFSMCFRRKVAVLLCNKLCAAEWVKPAFTKKLKGLSMPRAASMGFRFKNNIMFLVYLVLTRRVVLRWRRGSLKNVKGVYSLWFIVDRKRQVVGWEWPVVWEMLPDVKNIVREAKTMLEDDKTPLQKVKTPLRVSKTPLQELKSVLKETKTLLKEVKSILKETKTPLQEVKRMVGEGKREGGVTEHGL